MLLTKKVAHETDYVSSIVLFCLVVFVVDYFEFEVFYSFVTFLKCIGLLSVLDV
jgi:hypothetical protein